MTESPSTGSGGQSSVLCPDGLPVYREILCPHNTVIQSSPFIHPYIPTGYEPGLNALPIRYPSIIAPAVSAPRASLLHLNPALSFLSLNPPFSLIAKL